MSPFPKSTPGAHEHVLRAILSSTTDAIILKDAQGKVLMINQAGARLFGLVESEILGTDLAQMFEPGAASARLVSETDRRVIETGAILTFEQSGRINDPSQVFLVTKTPWRDEHGRIIGLVSVAKDITERKRAEEAMRAQARELETLLGVASHDLREPLRAMSALAGILQDDYGPRLDDEGRDLLERILRGTQRMEELIDGVALFVRAHRLSQAARAIDGGGAVAEALRRLEPVIARERASVTVTGPFPAVRAEKTWVVEVLYHLIGNALKFTANGQPPIVEVAAFQPSSEQEPEVGFIVRDRGAGVAVDSREKIFNLFRRAVGRDVPGIGVGLAIVREVAERHRGRAFVQGREGGGSEFTVTFGV